MMKMKKKWIIPALGLGLALLAGCNSQPDEEAVDRKYITTFDDYQSCVILPNCIWEYGVQSVGKSKNVWNQEKTEYISEGKGSIEVNLLEGNSYTGNIDANNIVSNIIDINGAKKISLDVYNPCSYPLNVTVAVKTADLEAGQNPPKTKDMVSMSQTCAPGQWTTVSKAIPVPQEKYATVKYYSITITNNTGNGELYTVYLDNFYIDF